MNSPWIMIPSAISFLSASYWNTIILAKIIEGM